MQTFLLFVIVLSSKTTNPSIACPVIQPKVIVPSYKTIYYFLTFSSHLSILSVPYQHLRKYQIAIFIKIQGVATPSFHSKSSFLWFSISISKFREIFVQFILTFTINKFQSNNLLIEQFSGHAYSHVSITGSDTFCTNYCKPRLQSIIELL